MKARYIVLALLAFTLTACTSKKDRYIREYQHFAENLIEQNDTYTANDWDAAESQYSQLRDRYAVYMMDMSAEERQGIDAINSRIDAIFLRHEIGGAATQLESIINEGVGLLEELFN